MTNPDNHPMKLYGMAQSRSFRALWALEESGLQYEYVAVKLFADSSVDDAAQSENYLQLNTQGKVPTLVDGDLVLTESIAILNYIARKAPECGLLAATSAAECAHHDELVCFILAELEQPLWSNGKHRFALPAEQRIPQMLDTASFEFAKAVAALDHLLERQPEIESAFAVGDSFSMVDILLAQTFNWAMRFEFEVPEKYVELRNRHYQRPAAQRALAVIE